MEGTGAGFSESSSGGDFSHLGGALGLCGSAPASFLRNFAVKLIDNVPSISLHSQVTQPHIYTSPPPRFFHTIFHHGLTPETGPSSLCCPVGRTGFFHVLGGKVPVLRPKKAKCRLQI